MKPNEYLQRILSEQTLKEGSEELADLRSRRKDVEALLRAELSESKPTIRYGGSKAKGTMIKEAYDLDITCYFPHDEDEAGSTLAEIYDNTVEALSGNYHVEQKASAIRLKDKTPESFALDFHIDVVPGRFTDDDKNNVFLHRTTGDKQRLKTNLQVHIAHIKESGVTEAIRLLKLWKTRNGLQVKTFVLELLVVGLLEKKKSSGISAQLEHVWTEFRDNTDSLSVEDPANSNNDLKPILDAARYELSSVASSTLWAVESSDWEAVFGKLKDAEDDRTAALKAAAVRASNPTKPWHKGS